LFFYYSRINSYFFIFVLGVASQSTTATAMARTLLVETTDMTTLLSSNLKGGCSKTAYVEDSIHLQKLHPAKLDAFYGQYNFNYVKNINRKVSELWANVRAQVGKTAQQTKELFRNLGTEF